MYCLLAIQHNCVSDKQTYRIMRYAKQCTITVSLQLHAYNYPDQGRSMMRLNNK